jgi:methionine-S-sulfoxide reductase
MPGVTMQRIAFFILSIAILLAFLPQKTIAEGSNHSKDKLETAYFAAGCFWKTQYKFSKVHGVVRTEVGYSGGTTANPTYEQVCNHTTGHAETCLVEFDPKVTTYRKLLDVFFRMHDPTTVNRQGPDIGTNYRSAIFYTTPEQKEEATAFIKELQARQSAHIVTEVKSAGPFYAAEDYHQNYFEKHGEVCN